MAVNRGVLFADDLTHTPSFIGDLLFSESGNLLQDPDCVVLVFTYYLYLCYLHAYIRSQV